MVEPRTASPRDDTRAARLLAEIQRAARPGRNEEDFKIAVETALAPIRAELGITPRYETTYVQAVSVLGGGSSDAVYDHLIIEYKRPGRLATAQGLREATEELERYLFAEASRYGKGWEPALRRMIGVALDGDAIMFPSIPRRTPDGLACRT